ncbi:serine/threonine protein kinase [Komarekiella sp. 'clone 1']|uniref:non-specific serine/threonine protein kinase n=1 Tax=Komarekiella delphini-convector SJRDD-AB1 TaxID=2593771 RepID=A0AA40ST15_9NOST|nr:serine/threonine-protein kinase [Komarekiella delphini-convector]MBD6614443.1 serine/threonine protein kinase [Komarekiella delphini-convector SJRDD-AB1]
MNRSYSKITNHGYTSQQTQLGQMCGSKQLFRDRYEILRILGRGGFGITYLAKNAVLPGNQLCVIKQLCVKVTSPQSWQRACDRFEKEAKTLGQLGSHSQIPLLLDYFENNGEFYLVQEYVQGFTLAQEVRRNGPKNEAAVKQFLQELLPVLQYLHKHRVIHRDIKPQNLLRCEYDGRVVLIDFGAVKEELADACENSINKTAFIGTMGFAPPEQLSLRPVYASDIYALGMTCLYLLTGKSPLEFDYDADTGEICWQKEVNISNDFGQVLSKMVKIPLDERFRTADDAIAALNWESYLPALNNCLTTQHLKNQTTKVENPQVYVPPVARTASAIRKWRARLKETKSCN